MSEKLVRDKMPDVCKENVDQKKEGWSEMKFRYADSIEIRGLLFEKLREEITELEVATKEKSRPEIVEEFADVREVLEGIMYQLGITPEAVEGVRIRKRNHRGGFRNGIVWDGNY